MADDVFGAIARDLQDVPIAAADAAALVPAVDANNERIAKAALRLVRMEDHPGTFDPWCRAQAPKASW